MGFEVVNEVVISAGKVDDILCLKGTELFSVPEDFDEKG
jgi:hypothetical protein